VTLPDRFSDWATGRASRVLASAVMTEHIPTAHAMRNSTLLILAMGNVLPKLLHAGAMRSDRTLAGFILTPRCVSEQ
jgi:hypothetical protein